MREYKFNIPIHKKLCITIEEAAEYACIGTHKLREIITNDSSLDFILHKGSQVVIKRKLFEKWLNGISFI